MNFRKILTGMIQPFLFDDLNNFIKPQSEVEFQKAGKTVVAWLYSVRKKAQEQDPQSKFIESINRCIKEIKAQTYLTTTQKEELILLAIEKKQAWTLQEIVEDTRLQTPEVKKILIDLVHRKIIRAVKRGSATVEPNKQILFKSNRIRGVEAGWPKK